jgi:hypothetical protein
MALGVYHNGLSTSIRVIGSRLSSTRPACAAGSADPTIPHAGQRIAALLERRRLAGLPRAARPRLCVQREVESENRIWNASPSERPGGARAAPLRAGQRPALQPEPHLRHVESPSVTFAVARGESRAAGAPASGRRSERRAGPDPLRARRIPAFSSWAGVPSLPWRHGGKSKAATLEEDRRCVRRSRPRPGAARISCRRWPLPGSCHPGSSWPGSPCRRGRARARG